MRLFSRKGGLLAEKNARLEEERSQLLAEIEQKEAEARSLKNAVKQLKLDRKIEEEDIKHMVKMKDERREIEFQKREAALQRDFDAKLAAEERSNQEKLEQLLHKEIGNTRATASELLARLPNVNVELSGGIGQYPTGQKLVDQTDGEA
jgi:hypothetical protein